MCVFRGTQKHATNKQKKKQIQKKQQKTIEPDKPVTLTPSSYSESKQPFTFDNHLLNEQICEEDEETVNMIENATLDPDQPTHPQHSV